MTGGDHRDPANFTVGSEVAGYRLEEQIGQGGMAVVYRARDVQLGRNVALKLLSPVLALDDAFRQRFIRESRAAAAVDHPYIIPIFAAGESDGALFIAMRYVQGGDVRTLIDAEGPLPPDRAAGIITQVALALDAAHLHGLVHRDIKPANMLLDSVAGSGQRDHVYLADFGLSKRSLSVTGLTSIGQFLGTPAYVAPEQVEGRPVDSRADQYALACASFEILSGAPPYERDDDLAVMWAHVSVPPPSLSERRPSLPAAADAVLARAMAKAPANRYPTCIAFARALRQALGAKVEPGELMVPEPGRPPTVVSGPAARRPGEPAGPRPHPATEISWPGARPEAGSAAAADQGGPGVPGRPAAPEPRAASQQHAAGPAERSAPPYGAPPSRDAPGPELPPPPGSYKPPPASFRPRDPSAAPDDAPASSRPGPPPAGPYEPRASFRPRDPSAAPDDAPASSRPGPPPAGPYEPRASFRPRDPSAAPDDAPASSRPGPPPAGPYEPRASFRPREPSAAPDDAPASSRPGPPAAGPYEPSTEDGWLAPLRSFRGEPAGAGASPPRQPPPYQPPRRESAGTGPPGRDDHGGAPPPGPDRSRQARNRRWWRRGAVAIGCAAVVGIAAGVVLGLDGGTKSPPAGGASSPGAGQGAVAVLPALSAPGCSTAVAGAAALSRVRSADVSVGSQPFGVVTTPGGHFSFVTLANAVAVLSNGSSLAPTLDYVLSAPGATGSEHLTSDGKYLLVAANSGAIVFSVADAEQGGSALVGTLTSPFGSGAVEVAVSPDDKFAFVTLENSADLVVFDLQSALANGFGTSAVVGKIPLHYAPVGLAISPDHRWLYATSRARVQTTAASEGTLTVIDLNRAETEPSSAVVSTATAGCSPVRVIASPDGRYVWVTSRDSNMLLGFSAPALRTDPAHALVVRVNVGPAPIGLALVDGGSRILVANSNLYGQHGVSTSIAVISTSAALSRHPALLGQISTGLLAREFGLAPDGKVALVTNSNSGQVQAIDLSTLP